MGRPRLYDDKEVLKFIIAYKRGNDGNSPSYRAIAHSMNISTASVARDIVNRLVDEGYLKVVDQQICVVGSRWVPSPTMLQEVGMT